MMKPRMRIRMDQLVEELKMVVMVMVGQMVMVLMSGMQEGMPLQA